MPLQITISTDHKNISDIEWHHSPLIFLKPEVDLVPPPPPHIAGTFSVRGRGGRVSFEPIPAYIIICSFVYLMKKTMLTLN